MDVFLCDLACGIPDTQRARIGHVDYLLNIASLSGVEESIADPTGFVRNNIELMGHVLDYARQTGPELMLHMGTDEEYGPAPDGYAHREWDTILPPTPTPHPKPRSRRWPPRPGGPSGCRSSSPAP
ncbi:NAD-dependent epimerase/dehydratase family protein [Streptomyces kaempferi]